MTARTGSSRAAWVGALMRLVVLTAGLGALLLFAYGLFMPRPVRGWEWRLPILLLPPLAVALMIAWPWQSEEARAKSLDGLAAVLGFTSMTVGLGAVIIIAYALFNEFHGSRVSVQTLVYRITHPRYWVGPILLTSATALPGGIGLWIARRRKKPAEKVSLAASAARFSIVGLICGGLMALLIAGVAFYRWVLWG